MLEKRKMIDTRETMRYFRIQPPRGLAGLTESSCSERSAKTLGPSAKILATLAARSNDQAKKPFGSLHLQPLPGWPPCRHGPLGFRNRRAEPSENTGRGPNKGRPHDLRRNLRGLSWPGRPWRRTRSGYLLAAAGRAALRRENTRHPAPGHSRGRNASVCFARSGEVECRARLFAIARRQGCERRASR